MLVSSMDPQDHTFHDLPTALAVFDMLQARAAARGVHLRPPPPTPTSCCGRGCNGCVWEGYFDAASYWRDEAVLILAE